MTDAEEPKKVPTGRDASSPFDEPTEQLSRPVAGRTIPETDDDLNPVPTEQLPVYRPREGEVPRPPSQPTEAYTAYTPPPTAVPPARVETVRTDTAPQVPAYSKRDLDPGLGRGTLDLGLLILRITVGGLFLFHGLQKLTGWWGGPGLDKMPDMVEHLGWKQPQISSVLLMVGEIGGGALLILGLATPLAAGAVLAVIIDAWLVRQAAAPGLQFTAPGGVEYETMLVAASASLILTGPGRIAVDGGRGWATRPYVGSFVVLLIAIAAAACMWIFMHGGNPFI
ncbi:DoxX family protein [Skermania sp. ID1734]|uniref:DoxX family protein n=1 Tax=Skermania sp. ID1734 TaxID=2597516 RepID=UPI002103BB48|nr:DoxX family protein [Skermania sp. ID1734]